MLSYLLIIGAVYIGILMFFLGGQKTDQNFYRFYVGGNQDRCCDWFDDFCRNAFQHFYPVGDARFFQS